MVKSLIYFYLKLGAAVGPLLAAYISNIFGWTSVFYMLMGSNVLAILVSLLSFLKLNQYEKLNMHSKNLIYAYNVDNLKYIISILFIYFSISEHI